MKKKTILLSLLAGLTLSNNSVKSQNCGGSFTQYQVLPRNNGENFRQFADINGDGLTDLITQDNGTIARFYLNTGSGYSSSGSLQLPAFGNVVAAKDFDNDGRVDLLSNSITGTNCLSNQIRIFWNTGQNNAFFSAGLSTNLPLPVNPYCMQSQDIDFNGDGLLDIIATSMPFSPSTNSPGRTYLNNGNRNFSVAADFLWPRDLYGTHTRDFNGDGNADFLVTIKDGWADGLRGMYYYRGNGNGTFQAPIVNFNSAPLAAGGIPIQADPLNNNTEDVLMSLNGVSPSTIKLGRWNGVNNFVFNDISIPSGFATSQAYDFDLDGKQDIMLLSTNGQNILRWMTGNGNGTYNSNTINILQANGYNLSTLFKDTNPNTQYISGSNSNTLIIYRRNVAQTSFVTENITVCGNYIWNGNTYTQGGTYDWTGTNLAGCDSVVTLNLIINQPSASTVNASITEGETYSFNGQNLTAAGTYTATLQNAAGCDSVVTLNLTVEPAVEPLNCNISPSNNNLCGIESITLNIENPSPIEFIENFDNYFNDNRWQGVANRIFTYNGSNTLGRFHQDTISYQLLGLPDHDSLLIDFDLYIIDTWDGNSYSGIYPADFWQFNLDATTLLRTTFGGSCSGLASANQSFPQNYPSNNPCGTGASLLNLPNVCLNAGSNNSFMYHLQFKVPHSSNGAVFAFSDELQNGLCNESWALDNFSVKLIGASSSSILWSTGETTSSISVSPSETTTYSVTVTQGTQTCTSEVTITVNQPSITTETVTACGNYAWKGNTYTQSGTYTWTGTNAAGCDSVVTLNLSITPQPEQPQLACWQTATFDAASCSWVIVGTQPVEPTDLACWESATFNANTCAWVVSGTQPQQPTNLACYETALFVDTLCNWVVTGTPAPAIVTNASACVSYTWEANGETYSTTGQYSFNSNCEEYTLNLTINQPSTSSVNATITEGESYSFNGQSLTTAGTYTATLQNAAGCDSVVTLNLTVEPAVEPLNCEISASTNGICNGLSSMLTVPFQQMESTSIEALNNFIFSAIDPATDKRNIWKKPNLSGNYEPIFNDSYNRVQVSVGNDNGKIAYVKYRNNLPNGASDSAWVCTSLINGSEEVVHFLVPNFNRDDVTSLDWSDDNTKLVLTLFNDLYPTLTRDGDVFTYTFSTSALTNISNDFDFYNNMVVYQKGTDNVIYNRNETGWVAWNVLLYQQNINGGPSTQIVGANGFSFPNSNIFPTDANSNFIYYRRGGNQSGSSRFLYKKDLNSGIESVVVNAPGRSGIELNDSLIAWIDFTNNVHVWNMNQEEVAVFPVSSIGSFNLDSYYYQTANDNNYDLQWLGNWATQPTTSILWSTGETTPSISVSPNETTTYSVTVTQGDQTCTSDVTITVNQPSAIAETASACNNFTWNGNTYTQSGTYTWTGTNAAGCDSVVTLNLTITLQPEQPQTACWQTATFNANTCAWVVSGTQPEQPTNLACYETALFVDTLCNWVVTGTPAPAIVTNASACVSYTWEANGETYSTSGQYSFNSNCQEFVLNLVINQPVAETVNATITEGDSYSFNGQSLTTAGTYTATLQNAAGCDSVVTLNLTVEPAVEPLNCEITASEANVCVGETVALNINGIANSTGLAICSVEALPENLQQGLVGFYPFCGNANDVSGNANNGVVNGAVFSTDRFDNAGSSLELDGNDYVTIQPVSALNGLTNYTISVWVKQNDMPIGRGVIFSNWVNNTIPTGTPISNILWANQNRAQLALRAGQESTTLPINQFNNNWVNITAVYNGPNPNALSRLKFYIDGIETAIDCGFVASNCNHPSSLGTIANEGYIGARRVANSIVEYFNGKIDDLFLFNRSLSIEEVEQISSLSGNNSSILWSTGETTPTISVSPSETTTYSVTVTQGGQTCTSEVTISVNQPSSETVNATITEGESYNFNGQNLTAAGTYTATLQNAAGCDSVVTLNLTVNPAPVAGCYAASVVSFNQGDSFDGTSVSAIRSNAELALGMPEPVVTNVVNFVSLGFGGSITLAFEAPIANGEGNDIRIDEATWNNNPCNRYPERADVFASQDGVNFVYLGVACQDASFDLGALSWAQYVRIVDISDLLSFSHGADGFDVNGIECLNGAATSLNDDGLVACSLQEIVSYTPGNRKNGTAVGSPRNNPTNALGTPQNNNTINFTALGFGGTMVAKFDYVVFNQPGNDLRVTETSFGNPSCNNYPEKARVSVSMDNVNWTELGEICQDGEIDLANVNYAQYIKIQDASPLSSNKFNGAADGYDVDAVVVLNNGCGTSSARLAQMDNTTTPDASLMVSAFPNPMEDYTIVNFEGLENDSDFNFQIMDAAGRVIRSNNIRVSTANPTYLFDASELARGIYQVVIANDNGGQIIRIVK